MPKPNNRSLEYEKTRLSLILQKIDQALIDKQEERIRLQDEIQYIQAHFNGDNFQNDIDLSVNSALLSAAETLLAGLNVSSQKPYFARIDFKEDQGKEHEVLYIGKMNFTEKPGETPLIVDWRAPVSNLYYESRLGEAEYLCPEGTIKGDLALKRQYVIQNRILEQYHDIDLTTNDELLQNAIIANTDKRLKDIAATIQIEQNKIIRSGMWVPIIVQGAAGSGKTTVALHRMAYMIYQYAEKFDPEHFIIIGPNKFFLDYISDVLPELGVTHVTQSTYEDMAMEFIGKKLKVKNKNESLENGFGTYEQKKMIMFKASLKYRDAIKLYLDKRIQEILPKRNITLDQFTVMDYSKIRYLFHTYLNYLPPYERLPVMKDHIRKLMKDTVAKVSEMIEIQCNNTLLTLKREQANSPERQALIIQAIEQRDNTLLFMKKNNRKLVDQYFKEIKKVAAQDYYMDFLRDTVTNANGILKEIAQETLASIEKGVYELDDLAPLMYIRQYMYGTGEFKEIKHVVIDEAQDLSLFQLYALKVCTPGSSYTVLGDVCQGIYSYRGISDWSYLQEIMATDRGCKYEVLRQSYRNTVEVMTEASKVISRVKPFAPYIAKPVIRHGNPVTYKKIDQQQLCDEVSHLLDLCKKAGRKSVAIICKTLSKCKSLQKVLDKNGIEMNLITGSEKEYSGGNVLLPVYHAKGLEFETVIIPDADDETYHMDTHDAKLLYVAMTRPIHDLHLFTTGNWTGLVDP